jgi:hypothetical protein
MPDEPIPDPLPTSFDLSFEDAALGSSMPPSPFLDVGKGELRRIVALGVGDTQVGRTVDLLALEVYDTGAILTFRASGERQHRDEMRWLAWSCLVRDEQSTTYHTLAGGVGQSELWRGEVLIHPAPDRTRERLTFELRCDGAVDARWVFRISLAETNAGKSTSP